MRRHVAEARIEARIKPGRGEGAVGECTEAASDAEMARVKVRRKIGRGRTNGRGGGGGGEGPEWAPCDSRTKNGD